jgi:hypothetical protein
MVVAETDAGVGVLGDHAVLDAVAKGYLGVDEVLEHGVHLEVGGVLVEHQPLPGAKRQGARAPAPAAFPHGRLQHEVDGGECLQRVPLDVQRDGAHEMHPRRAARQVAGGCPQGQFGQTKRFIVLPALRALEQSSHCRRIAAQDVTSSVSYLIGRFRRDLTADGPSRLTTLVLATPAKACWRQFVHCLSPQAGHCLRVQACADGIAGTGRHLSGITLRCDGCQPEFTPNVVELTSHCATG